MSWPTVVDNAIYPSTVLTNSYVFTNPIEVTNQTQLTALVNFTLGSLTSMNLKVQLSADRTVTAANADTANWYDYEIDDTQNETSSGTTATIPARSLVRQFLGTCMLAIQVPVKAPFMRFAVQGVGTVTGSSVAITVLSGVA